MIERLRDALAPPKPARGGETGYRRLLCWAALPVTDRRWAAPLSAVALGFGLFVGVAIGPGATGSVATGAAQIIEIPGFSGGTDSGRGGGGREEPSTTTAAPASSSSGGGEESFPAFTPIAAGEEEAPEAAGGEPSHSAPSPDEEEEPAQTEDQDLAGTVVHVNPAAASYTVAETGGVMSAVHAGKLPPAGTQIEVPIRTLANGTLAEAGKRRKSGTRTAATLAGIVTFVESNAATPAYAVSNRGASVLVHVHPEPSGAVPPLPALGAYASVTVNIEAPQPALPAAAETAAEPTATAPTPATPSCAPDPAQPPAAVEPKSVLWQREFGGGGAPFTHSDFEGIVAAVCPDTAQLLISADDVREAGHDLLFAVPPGIDATKVTVGQSVAAGADIGAGGSLTLTGLAGDERLKGADDAKAIQGDLVPEKSKGKG